MSRWDALVDPSNPCNLTGLSDEVEAILDYLLAAHAGGLDVVVTSTTDHPYKAASGHVSRHRQPGTNGEGLAVDARLRRRGNDIHRAVFDAFVPVERQLHELIYAAAPYNIKAGQRIPPYAVASHHDHVHVAVVRDTFLRWRGATPTPAQEAAMAQVPNVAGWCITSGDHLIVTDTGGAVFAYSPEGSPDVPPGVWINAYNANPDLAAGSDRRCIGVYTTSPDGKPAPNGAAQGYTQVFDDGARYRWLK